MKPIISNLISASHTSEERELLEKVREMEYERLKREALNKSCKICGKILNQEDVDNSLYGSHYHLCRGCASKISV